MEHPLEDKHVFSFALGVAIAWLMAMFEPRDRFLLVFFTCLTRDLAGLVAGHVVMHLAHKVGALAWPQGFRWTWTF